MRNFLQGSTLLFTFLGGMFVTIAQVNKRNITSQPPPAAREYNTRTWKEFSSDEGQFSIRLPGTPQPKTLSADSSPKILSSQTFILDSGTGEYAVTYGSLSAKERRQVESVFVSTRSKLLSGDENARLLSEAPVVHDGNLGREWMVESGNKIITARAIVVNDKYYRLIFSTRPNVVFSSGRPGPPPARLTSFYEGIVHNFFGSFQLLAGPNR